MQGMAVGIGIDGHGLDAHFPACPHDANGNFPTVGDEYFLDHASALDRVLSGKCFDKVSPKAYHRRLMSARQTIDSLQFARSGGEVSGEFFRDDLSRLGEVLAEAGCVRYVLSGGIEAGRPVLRIRLSAPLVLVCQRCLGVYPHLLEVERVLPVAASEAQLSLWEKENPLLEVLLADPKMSVVDLVEDEVLLGLPVAPRHPEGGCEGASLRGCLQ